MLSLELVPVRVEPKGTNEQDPSTGVAYMAVVPEGTRPVTGDWKPAEWDRDHWPPHAQILVGPMGAVAPAVGQYDVWVKFGVGTESPVLPAGSLEVY